jgi:hypothetical protein
MGHLVGSANPTRRRPTWHHQCHLTNLWEWPRNTLPSSLHHWSQVGAWSRVQKRLYMDSWTHHAYVGAQMDKGATYPHYTTHLVAPHQRRRSHSIVGVALRHPPSADGPFPPNRHIFWHVQEDTKWSNVVHQFEVVHWRFDPRARRACHMDWWHGNGVAATPP